MVCLGNICRSPLAQGILESKVTAAGMALYVDSAGTGSYHAGEQPHRSSIKVAKANGIDITSQRARQFNTADFDRFDFIFAMDGENLADILRLKPTSSGRVHISRLLDVSDTFTGKDVPDPWYGTEKDFYEVFQLLSEACDEVLAFISRND